MCHSEYTPTSMYGTSFQIIPMYSKNAYVSLNYLQLTIISALLDFPNAPLYPQFLEIFVSFTYAEFKQQNRVYSALHYYCVNVDGENVSCS